VEDDIDLEGITNSNFTIRFL